MRLPSPARGRRGGPAIEFALVLPVFVFVMAVIFEYSWYFFMQATVMGAAESGCRAGAVVPPDENPMEVAQDNAADAMGAYSFWGADCADSDDSRCNISIATSGASPTEVISCQVAIQYPGMTGMVPVPSAITFSTARIFEVQR